MAMKAGKLLGATVAVAMALGAVPAGAQQAPTAPAPAAQVPATQTLPGGASTLRETFDDWLVNCGVMEGATRCAVAQQQTSQQTRQLLLAVELAAVAGDKVEGTLVLPFGLALDSGVTLQVDEQPAGGSLRFRTCVPVGCLVNLAFNGDELKSLRAGKALKIAGKADGGADVALSVSLKGFAPALDRLRALAK